MESTETATVIRDAVDADAAALAGLATHLGYAATEEAMRGRMARIAARPEYRTIVAERHGRVIGFAGLLRALSYTYDEPSVRLLALVVDPAERGRGTGAALVAAAEAWAREQGAAQVHLTTALHRDGAHRFYERIGYARTGLRYVKKLA